MHQESINSRGGIIYDEKDEIPEEDLNRDDLTYYPVPLSEIVEELGGQSIMGNTVALGAARALMLNIESEIIIS